METAIGAAGWLVGKVLNKLSNELVAAYVASSELGLNSEQIKTKLKYMQGLLHAAQDRDVSSNPGLQSLLDDLSKKADEAEDALDELHYFMIQDQLDGTQEAAPELRDALRGHALHGRDAALNIIGNWLPFFSCLRTQDDDCAAAIAGNLKFDRVTMSNKIKSVIDGIHNLCDPVSDLLNKIPNTNTTITLQRPHTGSTVAQDKLYGRGAIFEQTVNALISGTYDGETLSVLPFVGPGGIGKTTFTQYLYNDKRIEGHFTVKVWVCVSTDFDVLKLTRQIHSCIPAIEKEEYNCTHETANLDQLQKSIGERLKSKRFLIVLDDIWKCNSQTDWNNLLAPFRQGETKGSMVLVTTRFPSIAHMVKTTDPVELHGLEPNDFFEFFEACMFGHSKPEHYEDELIDVARDIAKKLKGSPLAANTVGRLLEKNLSRDYWIGVLEKDEWQNAKDVDDIMPSLKISYDCLPFLLKKCFSYFALFPEDYRFYNLKFTSFWTAIGILDSSCQDNNNYLEELVDNGFLMKGVDKSNDEYYLMHDLLHDLSRNVSSQECVNISNSSFSADNIPQSIRHLSVTIDTKNIDENFEEEIGKLKSMIDVKNLRSLMIFGYHDARIANIFKNAFEDINCLRVLFIRMNTPESLPNNFSNLIHLQYLKISSPSLKEMSLPSTLHRFYHLKFLDLENWHGSKKMHKDTSRLVNLCYFSSSKKLHSNIPEVGKMKCLHELKEFCVKKESTGFELREMGELRELGGELTLCNLQTVASKGDASAAKLKNKRNLKELRLVWGTEHKTIDDDVLDGLQPHPNLRVLGIINPGQRPCPRWLCGDVSTKRLEMLHLEGLSWCTLPDFEQLPHLTSLTLKNIARMRVFGPGFSGVTERSFMHLKKLEFENMPELEKWVREPNPRLFSRLETIKFAGCPLLSFFPFLECSNLFTSLCSLHIDNCPELSQFPPMPHTSTLTDIRVKNGGSELLYDGKKLSIEGYAGALAFHNMDKVEVMNITDVSHISFSDLQKVKSLRSIHFKKCKDMFSAELDESAVLHSVQTLVIDELCPSGELVSISGESFSKVLKCCPAVSQLTIRNCESLELLPVEDGGLLDLEMLRSFIGWGCGNLFSRWPKGEVGGGAHAIKPFPTSLRELDISFESSMQSMGLLSNLTSLTSLRLVSGCKELTMDGFNPLITVNLKKLIVNAMHSRQGNISIAGDLFSQIARSNLMHAGSFQLEKLEVDSISAVLTVPICNHLAASLHTLKFSYDQCATTFTEEQEQALQLLTSLKNLEFHDCNNLQSFPQVLHGLSSLKRLVIFGCEKVLCLPPKEGLPASLEYLAVCCYSTELNEEARKLKESDPWFSVQALGL
ncbi:putative disease resistance protein RGA3 [Triticum urartu]|uniref:putative disease resistance protein RGA3 n=1 Tax=Triticum urartu TaxID=4572 RepID=UPI0020430B80|nr:putative disease resistance protein RGA3 [Triticum urartu]XP_048537071.1 putative disease resistance protein RGA3 [Triticum urartu]XP_048537072.1 putative disease resistance protein RGA3 [Triticum urartu]XP_048537073.1 putative disease resistance protein RGA3 [Triticum urartu]XP_048537074.1 putative disease resistance protein RGA3 [Triticum urartu]XP_048537075.1 putative disease resistance protein RGA3 [Triticum urartu]XP_048537076.1 putative disease resistance protein RGA3 [Triticum urart